jgi:hypothetical protein
MQISRFFSSELDSSYSAQREDLTVLRGRRSVRVHYLRGCQTWIDSGASTMTANFHLALSAKIQYCTPIQS